MHARRTGGIRTQLLLLAALSAALAVGITHGAAALGDSSAVLSNAAASDDRPRFVGWALLLSVSTAAFLGWRVQKWIAPPLKVLKQAADRIAKEGDHSVRVEQKPSGQVGRLGTAFNSMLDRLAADQERLETDHDELKARMRERTRELHREVLLRRYAESITRGQSRFLQVLSSERPLDEVLALLVGEIESHTRHTRVAISPIEAGAEWFGEPIGSQLGKQERNGLRQLPIAASGAAPARAAATFDPHHDLADTDHGTTDASGFCSTEHGGACWAFPVVTVDERLVAVITLFHRHDRGPSQEERELIQSACSLAGLAIERHQRVESDFQTA